MYFKQQDFPKAVEQFKRLTENEPRNVEWQYGYAETLVKSGEVPRAIEALNTTEDQVGINPQLSIQKYSLYMSVDQMESAVKEIELARESYPKDAQLIATLVDPSCRYSSAKVKMTRRLLCLKLLLRPTLRMEEHIWH